MEKRFTHIFFDLDQTLWDFRKNSLEVIQRLFQELDLLNHGVPDFETFISNYKVINNKLWGDYKKGIIDKATLNNKRFSDSLKPYCKNAEELGARMAKLYIIYSPETVTLFEDVNEVLEYLSKKYELQVLSNGFEEIQFPKLKNTGLDKYFKDVILGEEAGCLKPDKRFFEYSLKKSGAKREQCILIGDDPESDIAGAANAGISQVWFKQAVHNGINDLKASYVISSLKELKQIL